MIAEIRYLRHTGYNKIVILSGANGSHFRSVSHDRRIRRNSQRSFVVYATRDDKLRWGFALLPSLVRALASLTLSGPLDKF